MKAIIEKCENGYILKVINDNWSENMSKVDKYVFSFDELSKESEIEIVKDLLWHITDNVCLLTSGKYDKKRIYIYSANGHDYEGDDKELECPHCYRKYKEGN